MIFPQGERDSAAMVDLARREFMDPMGHIYEPGEVSDEDLNFLELLRECIDASPDHKGELCDCPLCKPEK